MWKVPPQAEMRETEQRLKTIWKKHLGQKWANSEGKKLETTMDIPFSLFVNVLASVV